MTHANPERLDCLLLQLPPLKQCSTGGTRHGHCPYCPAVVSISTGARCCGVCFRHKRETEGTPPWAMGPSSHSAPNPRKQAPVDALRQDGRGALPSFRASMTSRPIGVAASTQASNVSAGYRANGDTGSVTPYTPLSPRYDAYAAPYSPTSPRYSPATPVWSPAASPSPRYNTATPRYSPPSRPSRPAYVHPIQPEPGVHAPVRLEAVFAGILTDVAAVLPDVASVLTDVAGILAEIAGVLTDIAGVLTDIAGVRADVAGVLTGECGLGLARWSGVISGA